jgi:hypothetical protein
MGNEVKLDRPLLSLNFELEDVTLGINRYQFTSILDILQYFVLYARGLKVRSRITSSAFSFCRFSSSSPLVCRYFQ